MIANYNRISKMLHLKSANLFLILSLPVVSLMYLRVRDGKKPERGFQHIESFGRKRHGRAKDKSHPNLDPHTTSMTQQVEQLFRTHTYEMSISPSKNDEPVKVGVAILIESISDISEVNMDLTFTLRIWKSWKDDRLKMKGQHESIVLPSRLIDKLWVPDLFIIGSKKSFIHRTTVDNIMLRLYNNGTISYRAKITTTVACQMNLYNFPLDIENCTLAVQSLAYTDDEVVLEWWMGEDRNTLFMDPKLVSNMPKFKLVHHRLHTSTVSAKQGGGQMSQLRISFELKRYLLSVFFQSYFPAIVMVVLAGLAMWMDPRSAPARVAMGITSVLTISTVITGLKSSLPKVSYLTAMDLFLWACFLFVFSTVLEYCILNWFMTTQFKNNDKKYSEGIMQDNQKNTLPKNASQEPYMWSAASNSKGRHGTSFRSNDEESAFESFPHQQRSVTSVLCNKSSVFGPKKNKSVDLTGRSTISLLCCRVVNATKIDYYFRLIYFASFIVFNIVYWTYYVISTRHSSNDAD